ncbi:ATP-binding protein [Bifidobacterium dentium]|uniref:BbrUII/HgiDII family restriction enzyme n=1 Tax=Bifidobacterium dentium TaxID=1689 RepID=UPI0022E2F35B|nr:ATP-binding protein [Bifidobacterium dentium]
MSQQYTLTVDIATIDSLGRNLYSNAAAVLSEFVANAWDADANKVEIEYVPEESSGLIRITDDGCGMTENELNSRFLTVGYNKRNHEGDVSWKFKRPYMGRKGIGKLSAFSLADKMVVSSKKEGSNDAHGFTIDVNEMEEKIAGTNPEDRVYHPVPLERNEMGFEKNEHGTRIILSNLRKKRVKLTLEALRRRLARRFDVLGLASMDADKGGFTIIINGCPITYEDRGDLQKLEHIWLLGDYELPEDAHKSAMVHHIDDVSIDGHPDWKISGWIGSVKKPADRVFKNDDESMKNIIVLARRRPIQEGLLDHLDFDKHFASYVTGQIQADFLDQDDQDDIATSDRQRLVEDDERVRAFNQKIREIFNEASDQWSEYRRDSNTQELFESVPAVKTWVNDLPRGYKNAAIKILNRVSGINDLTPDERKSLYQSSIAAFTKLQQHGEIEKLNEVENISEIQLLTILNSYMDYEDMEYAQTIRSRLKVIQKLEKLLDKNELENATRDYIAKNPWLIEPSWERATNDVTKERTFKRIARDDFHVEFDDDGDANKRVDIIYMTPAGSQVIVEFKRYGRKVIIDKVLQQIKGYARAMTRLLQQQDPKSSSTNASQIDNRVQIIIVVKNVYDDLDKSKMLPPEEANDQVRPYNARFLYFSEMIERSRERYQEFIDATDNNDYAGQAIRALNI